jgi:RNA polymerase sigma-70 factor (ECF subfamily)
LLEEEAIRRYLREEAPRLVSALALITESRQEAEDAVQEALARAWERSTREEIHSLPAWIRTTAFNFARNRARRRRLELRARRRLGPEESFPAAEGDRIDIRRALANLPRRQREVTVLHYYLGLDIAEVAKTLRVHEGTVKTSLHRARRTLADALGERDTEEANERGHR